MARYTAEQVYDALTDTSANAQDDYSGRSMYGALCPSFTVEAINEAFSVFVELAENDPEMAMGLAKGARSDSMGHGMVIYWPNITYPKQNTP